MAATGLEGKGWDRGSRQGGGQRGARPALLGGGGARDERRRWLVADGDPGRPEPGLTGAWGRGCTWRRQTTRGDECWWGRCGSGHFALRDWFGGSASAYGGNLASSGRGVSWRLARGLISSARWIRPV